MIKVSVIVPVYNVEKYVERCARSLFDQTLEDMEYIFVDDCTPDRSMEVLEKVIEDYPERRKQIHIVRHPENRGLPSARNSGLALVKGEYIIHCDSDDWVENDMYEKMYEKAKEENADIVGCDFYKEYLKDRKYVKQNFNLPRKEYFANLLSGNDFVGGYIWCRLVKKELYRQYHLTFYESANMWEDLAMTVRLHRFANRIAYVEDALYHYVQYNFGSLVANQNIRRLEDKIRVVDFIKLFLEKEGILTDYYPAFAERALNAKEGYIFSEQWRDFNRWRDLWPEIHKYIVTSGKRADMKIIYWLVAHKYDRLSLCGIKLKYLLKGWTVKK